MQQAKTICEMTIKSFYPHSCTVHRHAGDLRAVENKQQRMQLIKHWSDPYQDVTPLKRSLGWIPNGVAYQSTCLAFASCVLYIWCKIFSMDMRWIFPKFDFHFITKRLLQYNQNFYISSGPCHPSKLKRQV